MAIAMTATKRKHVRSTRKPAGATPAAGGMTLIELLVSITILIVMILAFSTILVQSQRFIQVAQATRRSFSVAATISRIIRNDVRQASQNGFLAIATPTDDSPPRLILTTAGASRSLLIDANGTGTLVCYGLCDNKVGEDKKVLWRPRWVLWKFNPDGPASVVQSDVLNMDFGAVQSMARVQDPNNADTMNMIVDWAQGLNPSFTLPPTEIGHIEELWQVLAPDCSNLSITWTDGTAQDSNSLNWYGVDHQDTRRGPIIRCGNPAIETDVGAGYRALWTHHDQTIWPKAIKIRFTIADKNMPKEFRRRGNKPGLDYEVICNLGQ